MLQIFLRDTGYNHTINPESSEVKKGQTLGTGFAGTASETWFSKEAKSHLVILITMEKKDTLKKNTSS